MNFIFPSSGGGTSYNQSLNTSDSPTFDNGSFSGNVSLTGTGAFIVYNSTGSFSLPVLVDVLGGGSPDQILLSNEFGTLNAPMGFSVGPLGGSALIGLNLDGSASFASNLISFDLSGGITAITFYGDGSKLTNTPSTITATGDEVLAVPSGTPVSGDRAKYYITASGADRNFKVDVAIKIPSDSGFDNGAGKTMTSGKLYIVLLEYNGTDWMLVSMVGGY